MKGSCYFKHKNKRKNIPKFQFGSFSQPILNQDTLQYLDGLNNPMQGINDQINDISGGTTQHLPVDNNNRSLSQGQIYADTQAGNSSYKRGNPLNPIFNERNFSILAPLNLGLRAISNKVAEGRRRPNINRYQHMAYSDGRTENDRYGYYEEGGFEDAYEAEIEDYLLSDLEDNGSDRTTTSDVEKESLIHRRRRERFERAKIQTQDPYAGLFQPQVQSTGGLRQELADKESFGGDYTATSPHSSAAGKYQFLWGTHGPTIKKLTGVSSKSEFLNNKQAQEDYFTYWDQNTLTPTALSLQKEGYNMPLNDLKKLVHFKGAGGAREYLRTGKDRTSKNNMSIPDYIGKTVKKPNHNHIQPQFTSTGRSGLKNADQWAISIGNEVARYIPNLKVNSIYRTPSHNASVGGGSKSFHLKGKALDIKPQDWKRIPAAVRQQILNRYNAEAINEGDHIHLEPRPTYQYGGVYMADRADIYNLEKLNKKFKYL